MAAPDLTPPAPLAVAASSALDRPLDEQPAAVYLAALTKRSRRSQRSALNTLAQLLGYPDALTCPWSSLRYQHTAALRAQLQERYAPATANRMLAALRRVLQEAWRLGQLDAETYRRAADLKIIKGEQLPAGRALAMDEVAALLGVCAADATPAGARDAALIAVLIATGARRSEAAALQVSDYQAATGALKIRSGKGRKDRLVYVTGAAATALTDWLMVRGADTGALFTATTKGGHATLRAMTDQAIRLILQRRAVEAGVAECTPHDLRRTCITELLDAGADVVAVSRLAGHADPATTARYDRRGEAAKQQAAAKLELPPIARRTLPRD